MWEIKQTKPDLLLEQTHFQSIRFLSKVLNEVAQYTSGAVIDIQDRKEINDILRHFMQGLVY